MAEFNIRKEKALLYEYLTLVEGAYYRFINKNKINHADIGNIYVANMNELFEMDDQRWKLKTEEEVKKAQARAEELADFLKKPYDPENTPRKKYSELDPNKDYTEFKVENEIEFYKELLADLRAKIGNFIVEKNINDKKDPIYILVFKVQLMYDSLIMYPKRTLDDLKDIRAKIDFIEEYINEVIKQNG